MCVSCVSVWLYNLQSLIIMSILCFSFSIRLTVIDGAFVLCLKNFFTTYNHWPCVCAVFQFFLYNLQSLTVCLSCALVLQYNLQSLTMCLSCALVLQYNLQSLTMCLSCVWVFLYNLQSLTLCLSCVWVFLYNLQSLTLCLSCVSVLLFNL